MCNSTVDVMGDGPVPGQSRPIRIKIRVNSISVILIITGTNLDADRTAPTERLVYRIRDTSV